MARRKKGGIALTAPPFVAPALRAANGGAGLQCDGCGAPLDADAAKLRRIAFEPRRPKDCNHSSIASRLDFECHRCGDTVSIELHFLRPTRLATLAIAVQCSHIQQVPTDAT